MELLLTPPELKQLKELLTTLKFYQTGDKKNKSAIPPVIKLRTINDHYIKIYYGSHLKSKIHLKSLFDNTHRQGGSIDQPRFNLLKVVKNIPCYINALNLLNKIKELQQHPKYLAFMKPREQNNNKIGYQPTSQYFNWLIGGFYFIFNLKTGDYRFINIKDKLLQPYFKN